MDKEKIETAVRMILEAIGENPDREGLKDTPRRVAKMYEEIFAGLINKPEDELSVFFTEEHDEMILVKDIPVYSMCEHHLLPFFGTAHIAYIWIEKEQPLYIQIQYTGRLTSPPH